MKRQTSREFYSIIKETVKKKVGTLLLKSLEYTHQSGQKVKVMEIPVWEEDNLFTLKIRFRLQTFITKINADSNPKNMYSFRDHLKKTLKWHEYTEIYKIDILKNNA
jgi:hypothetical protein